MKSTLVVREKGVPKNSALAKSEHELYEAMSGQFESFYSIGVILRRIMVDKEFNDAGFDSFAAYMNERQPCGINERHSFRLMAAMELRPLLPQLTHGDSQGVWTERAIRPLLHKTFSPADQKRLGKKIATRVKNGEKLTAALVKSICDEDRGVEKARAAKTAEEFKSVKTPAEVIAECRGEVLKWKQALGKVPGAFWKDAETDDPGCCKELSEILSEFASFIGS